MKISLANVALASTFFALTAPAQAVVYVQEVEVQYGATVPITAFGWHLIRVSQPIAVGAYEGVLSLDVSVPGGAYDVRFRPAGVLDDTCSPGCLIDGSSFVLTNPAGEQSILGLEGIWTHALHIDSFQIQGTPEQELAGIGTWSRSYQFLLEQTRRLDDPGTVVPIPAALPLLGSGVLGLAGLAWRRRRVA